MKGWIYRILCGIFVSSLQHLKDEMQMFLSREYLYLLVLLPPLTVSNQFIQDFMNPKSWVCTNSLPLYDSIPNSLLILTFIYVITLYWLINMSEIFHLSCLTNEPPCIARPSYVCCGHKNLKNFILFFKNFRIHILILFWF